MRMYVLTSIVDLCLSTSGQRYQAQSTSTNPPQSPRHDSDRRRIVQNLMKLEICTLRERQTESDAERKRSSRMGEENGRETGGEGSLTAGPLITCQLQTFCDFDCHQRLLSAPISAGQVAMDPIQSL